MKLVYADPPYLGQCARTITSITMAEKCRWDGNCWDNVVAHYELLCWLIENADGFAYSCNPTDLARVGFVSSHGARVGAWTKTWHQIRPTTVQYAWEPVIFKPARKDNKRKPMVRDWLDCAVAMKTGQRGAKPDAFNDWILDLLVYEEGDGFIDLFPGSGSMAKSLLNDEIRTFCSASFRGQRNERKILR